MGAKLPEDGNYNKPVFSVMPTKDGLGEEVFTYAQSRWFYCYEYARLAPLTQDYKNLVERLDNGYNLNIVGYDGHSLDGKTMKEVILISLSPYFLISFFFSLSKSSCFFLKNAVV